MNRTQFFGAVLVIIGMFSLVVFPVIGIVAGEPLILFSVVGGWSIVLIGALVVTVSLALERLDDIKKEKFDKSF
jgi:uncharacterized membrane protein YhaH (DUF805 family)